MIQTKVTPAILRHFKGKKKITSLTAYDYPFARLLDESGIDVILVGDSMGMVIFGESGTRGVTVADICRATKSVRRGVKRALLISDMPYGSFDEPEQAVVNAKKLIEAGAEAVKIEDYGRGLDVAKALVNAKIPVMGHLGLTPQIAAVFKVQGKVKEEADRIADHAKAYEACGVFSLVLECIPAELATRITREVSIPTIGIGAGAATDGQILVTHDLLGLYPNMRPKFVRQFGNVAEVVKEAARKYIEATEKGDFPNEQETFHA